MKTKILYAGILLGLLLSITPVKAAQRVEGQNTEPVGTHRIQIQDIINLSGDTKERMIEFCREYGLIIHQMNQGNLDYSFQISLYGETNIVCVEIEENLVTEIYIKPSQTKLSVWVHRFKELFGDCIEIEKVFSENQQMQYMTWVTDRHYVSIVRMNQNMYLYITPCD